MSAMFKTPNQRRLTKLLREQEERRDREEEELQHQDEVWEALDFLKAFVKERWSTHWHSISIDCDLTLTQLREIGRLDQRTGVRACRRLIRVPVINEEIGLALWRRLEEDTREEDERDAHQKPELLPTPPATPPLVAVLPEGLTKWAAERAERKEEKEKAKQQQQQLDQQQWLAQHRPRPTCVFCNGYGHCKVPHSVAGSIAGDLDDQPQSTSRVSFLGRLRGLSASYGSQSCPTSSPSSPKDPENSFWQWEDESHGTAMRAERVHSDPGRRRSSAVSCLSSSTSRLSERFLRRITNVAIRRSFISLGESLSYGYGSRRQIRWRV